MNDGSVREWCRHKKLLKRFVVYTSTSLYLLVDSDWRMRRMEDMHVGQVTEFINETEYCSPYITLINCTISLIFVQLFVLIHNSIYSHLKKIVFRIFVRTLK